MHDVFLADHRGLSKNKLSLPSQDSMEPSQRKAAYIRIHIGEKSKMLFVDCHKSIKIITLGSGSLWSGCFTRNLNYRHYRSGFLAKQRLADLAADRH